MRATSTKTEHGFEAKAISGIHTILIALNCPDASRKGLKGFAFEREMIGPNSKGPKFLRSQKVFKSVVPDPKNARDPNSPDEIRGVLHRQIPGAELSVGRLRAAPGTKYRFRILPMYGEPGALETTAGRIGSNFDREGVRAGGPRRVVQPRRHCEPEIRRGVREQAAAGHQ